MDRWITFDKESAKVLKPQVPTEERRGEALDALLAADGPAVAIAPGSSADRVLVMTVRRAQPKPQPAPVIEMPAKAPRDEGHYVASGMLGLEDEFEYEEPEPPKKWWQKILG